VEQRTRAFRIQRYRVAVARQRRRRLFQRAAHLRRRRQRAGEELREQRPQQVRLQDYQAVVAEQTGQCRRHGASEAAAVRHEQLAGVGRARAVALALEELLRRLPHLRRYRQLVDRAALAIPVEPYPSHAAVGRKVVRVVDLAQVVILGGQPEYGDAAATQLLLVAVRQADRRDDLIQGVGRPAHEAGLLAGMHATGPGVSQRGGAGQRCLGGPELPVVTHQHVGQFRLRRARGPARAQRGSGVAGGMAEVAVGAPSQVVQVETAAPVHLGHGNAVRLDQFHTGSLRPRRGAGSAAGRSGGQA
jgi:hypothetical protein